ncbi:class I SAM-dependent methyltransferase [Mycobacterium sp. RTGN5]|uniref:class I SAM-dependent methyltransferase n=1 Tax=Mycobacterium sp. RTGN5 TaxID=3016522 RepID=UPI0029C88C07|nr:class I SAM-dependent methyltransferase [Mycobacterium sp. RTGN5]
MGLTGSWGGVERGGERDDFMVRLVNDLGKPRRKVLIFGAGTTLVFRVLHDDGFDVEGVDVSPDVVNYRSAEFPGQFAYADDLEHRSGAFDIITACEVFEHFHDPNRWLATLAQNLAPDGVLCGSTNFYPGSGPIEDNQTVGYMSLDGHVAYWSESALAKCCGRFDLEVVIFELECPGSVKPDAMWGSLFPNKRLFFASRDETVIKALNALKASTPILPCDTSDYPVQAYRAGTPPA